jgi:hypothetical protein
MVAALPRHAKRQLRAACRAGRAAVDSRATALAVPFLVRTAGLPAAVARMPRLRSLDCTLAFQADRAEVAGALAAAPASLAALKYAETPFTSPSADGGGPGSSALADALAARTGLADLDIDLGRRSPAQCAAFVAAVGRLPRLRTLRLSAALEHDGANPWREAPPALALPSTLQASAVGLRRLEAGHSGSVLCLPEPCSGGRPRLFRPCCRGVHCDSSLLRQQGRSVVEVLLMPQSRHLLGLTPQSLTLGDSAAWLLPPLLDRGAAALPALASLAFDANCAPAVMRRLFAERGLLARLTRLKVSDWRRLPPLPGPPDPEHCPGGMRLEDLEFEVREAAEDAAALAAWPMPRLRRLALSMLDPAPLRALLHAPWAAGLEDLHLTTIEGAFGVEVQSATC